MCGLLIHSGVAACPADWPACGPKTYAGTACRAGTKPSLLCSCVIGCVLDGIGSVLLRQMRARSRAEARAKGESDVRADDKYEEYAYSVCAPGTERTGKHAGEFSLVRDVRCVSLISFPLCVSGRWTKDEHERFVEGLKRHGKQWKKVAAYVGTRTVTQTKTHAQKYFQKIQKVRSLRASKCDFGRWSFDLFRTLTGVRASRRKAHTKAQAKHRGWRRQAEKEERRR